MAQARLTYSRAGIDVDKVKAALGKRLGSTFRARKGKFGEPVFPIGHYAGLIDAGNGRVLSLHIDNVGTKTIIARLMKKYDTIGIDCVAICANDLICTGSEPVAFLDYIALFKADPSVVLEIGEGLVEGAKQAEMAIVGGETAIVPELLSKEKGGGLDLVGMSIGISSKEDLILGDGIQKNDVLVGVASSGIHSNGLTFARKILLRRHSLRETVPELGRSLGRELLEPTRIYVKPTKEVLKNAEVHGLAHITGGGFSKLGRVIALAGVGAELDSLPDVPAIFRLIQKEGRVDDREMYSTFNMGIGFVVICPEKSVDMVIRSFTRHQVNAVYLGRVTAKRGIRVMGTAI